MGPGAALPNLQKQNTGTAALVFTLQNKIKLQLPLYYLAITKYSKGSDSVVLILCI